ncbi:FkbM family methyltransferase [Burkholderia ambifaria]|uniref:FkbM family methyltransferase n=1 Tax=Burkholderia ambifaria TaxID=152480 RepID=UPI0015897F1A|nr:FkbM family methyltransferase [Burkholderia ambifaria]
MQFVTHAQNFEDLMLFRALKDVEVGFYIDLGAADPDMHSVTKAFYDRGWSGINVEPGVEPHRRLSEVRQRDVNINCGIWSEIGELTIYSVDGDSELSTTNKWLAEKHRESGRIIIEKSIPVTTLSDICNRYIAGRDIHFLKIDVEGAEIEALKGNDFNKWRPWIILMESHEPERISTHWLPAENLLFDNGYEFVYCDGLNRFYISRERVDDLRRAFEVPPNIHDRWIRTEELALERRCADVEETLKTVWRQLEEAQARVKQVEADFAEAQRRAYEAQALLASHQNQSSSHKIYNQMD